MNDVPDQSTNEQKPKPLISKKWILLKNVVHASQLFKNPDAVVVEDLDDFFDEFNSHPEQIEHKRLQTITESAIDNLKSTQLLFLHIQRSTNADLQAIQFLISNHPSKYIRNSHDSNSFVNKPNTDGIRPLYEAARNGHNETVQLLLENGANPHLKSNDENSLQVACRWNYLVIVKILVNSTT